MIYKGDNTKEISFPLGGIGTGSIGLGGDGRLIDWEIFNCPSKGSINRYTHFAVRAIQKDKITPLILCGDIPRSIPADICKVSSKASDMAPNGTICVVFLILLM